MPSLTKKTEQITKPRTVKVPQSIVHIKHAPTLQQYKVWVLLLNTYRLAFERGETTDEKGFFRVSVSELHDLLGYEYPKAKLEDDLRALRKHELALSYIEKGGEPVKHYMGFLSEFKRTSKTIAFVLPSIAREAMEGLDQQGAMFQLINWEVFNQFTGKHEAWIYKLARDYVGRGRTPYMTVADFREYMGLKKGEYSAYKSLSQFVITKAVKAINEGINKEGKVFSDITVAVKYEKSGRNVLGLWFEVRHRTQTRLPFPEFEESPAFKFAKVDISPSKQTEYLALLPATDIEACIARVNEWGENIVKKGGKVDYGANYAKAIKEGWHVDYKAKTAKVEADQAAIKKRREKENEARETEQKQEDQAAKENAKLWASFFKRSESDQSAVIEQALAGNDFMLRQYRKEKRDGKDLSHGMRAAVCKFLRPNKK